MAITDNYNFPRGIRLAIIISFFFITQLSIAQISSTPSGGDWKLSSTWVGGIVPTSLDDVIIVAGANVVVRDPYVISAPAVCNSLTINGTLTMGAASSSDRVLDVTTFLLINTGGTLTNGGTAFHQISIGGNFTNNGTFNALINESVAPFRTGTIQINFTGSGTQLINGTSSTQNFQNIVINKPAGQAVTTSGGNVTTINASTFRQTSGDFAAPVTFSVSGNMILTAGTYTAGANTFIGGDFTRNAATSSFTAGSGTVTFNGISQSILGSGAATQATYTTFNNVVTNGAANVVSDYDLNIAGNLSIGTGSTFSVTGYDLNVSGTTTVGGSFVFSVSTLGTKTFNGLVIISSGGTWDNSFGENARFGTGISNNGTFISGIGVYFFIADSQLNGIFDIPNISVETANTLVNNGTLTISVFLDGGGTLQQGVNSTLNIGGGTAAVAILNASAAANTVNYTGGNQAIKGADYSNLGLSGSGTKTMNTSTTAITGVMTLSGTVSTTTVTNLTIGSLSIGSGSSLTTRISRTLTVANSLSGGGTLIQSDNSILNINGPSTLASINASAAGNIVNYNAASPLVIPGSYHNLFLNQSSGNATLNGNVSVGGSLTLNTGNLILGGNNLTLGVSSTLSIASPSATKMIIASGAGELRKTFSSIGSFVFPVGDNTSTLDYSPVTVNVTSATAFSSAYIGVSVADAKHPSNASTADFLTRYWNITQSGISTCVASITGTYTAGDITGTEVSIKAAQLNGDFNQTSNPWIKYASLASNSLSVTGASLSAGQASFTGITGVDPTVAITGGDVEICSGGSVSLGSTVTGDPAIIYSWSPSAGLSAANVADPIATVASTTTYNLTIYDANGITASTTTTITITAPPVSTPSAFICIGSTMNLSPNTGGTWVSNAPAVASINSTTGVATGLSSGSVTFTFTSTSTGCSNTTSAITVSPIPAKPTITPTNLLTDSPTLTSSSDSGNQWFKDNVAIAGATGKVFNVTVNGSYTVRVTTNGCTGPFSDAVDIVITGIEDRITSSNSRIYPNPAREIIQIDWSDFISGAGIEVRIYDQIGRLISTRAMAKTDNSIDVRSLVNGPYVFHARQNNLLLIQRFIKE